MSRDELEYAISQYADGTLAPIERPAVEERLATDPEARALLAEHRQFSSLLRNSLPVPEIAWDKLRAQISQACAAEPAPVRHFSIRSIGVVRSLAIAAAILLVATVAFHFRHSTQVVGEPADRMIVNVLQVPGSDGPVVEEIQISPSPVYAQMNRAADEIVARPTIVLIDRAASTAQDSDSGMY
jgi:negative regulator of sigma E activity